MAFRRSPTSVNLRTGEKKGAGVPLLQILLGIIAIAACVAAYYFYAKNSSLVASKESQATALINEVGQAILLPDTETPTIATVTDPKVLTGQPFFAHAEVGDKVLVYPVAKKAILYRPSIKKIIEVMPFELPPQAQTAQPAPAQ